MFVGRKKELDRLDALYKENIFQCVIMYGRRRVGKTFLLKEWLENKKGIYFAFEQQNNQVILDKFSEVVLRLLPSRHIHKFDSFEDALSYIGDQAIKDPIVLILDEFQYLATQDKNFMSMLQNLIDHQLLETKVKLVLCGSYMSFMENEVLAYKSPLYGRRTASMKLEPFGYKEAVRLINRASKEENFIVWALLGGMPLYLKQFSRSKTIKDNIIDKILEKGSMLHNEPLFALKQELKEPALYFSIIEAISLGKSKYNEISTFIGMDAGYYLSTLIKLGIVHKEIPLGMKYNTRKSLYGLEDPYFSFWFRYVSRSYSMVEMEQQTLMYEEIIERDLPRFLGHRFEAYCIEYLKIINGKKELPFVFTEIGRWWGSNPVTKKQCGIDIVARNKKRLLMCECKWRNEKTDASDIRKFIALKDLIKADAYELIFFSKSGYTKEAKIIAKKEQVQLMTLDTMVF